MAALSPAATHGSEPPQSHNGKEVAKITEPRSVDRLQTAAEFRKAAAQSGAMRQAIARRCQCHKSNHLATLSVNSSAGGALSFQWQRKQLMDRIAGKVGGESECSGPSF